MDLLRALGALAFTLESEHTLAQSLVFLESTLAHSLGAERVTIAFGSARPQMRDSCDVIAPLVLDARSIGFVTFRFTNQPTKRQRESVRVFASPLAALVAWRSQTSERGRLYELVRTDSLTGLANRMSFDERLDAAWQRAGDRGLSLSIALLDIDFFKIFNDRYGHVEGDGCLRAVGQSLVRAAGREGAFVARYGGEEFALVLEGKTHAEALAAIERVTQTFEDRPLAHEGSALGRISFSVGVASVVPAASLEIASLIRDADRSLYRAKALGRNRICAGTYTSRGAIVTRQARSICGPPAYEDASVARTADVAQILAALRRVSFVTLVGAAGIGKSRLACLAGMAASDVFSGGVAYVDFSSFAADSDPATLIAAAFDLDIDASGVRRGLFEALKERNALIVVDNVAGAVSRVVAAFCDELLASTTALAILATSRTALGCARERTIVVPSLDENASIELLRLRSGVTDVAYLRALARDCEGNALAIEAAALRALRRQHELEPVTAASSAEDRSPRRGVDAPAVQGIRATVEPTRSLRTVAKG